jgi:hypothetical protein
MPMFLGAHRHVRIALLRGCRAREGQGEHAEWADRGVQILRDLQVAAQGAFS